MIGVYVKLHSYGKIYIAFRPFQVINRIRVVAYKLNLLVVSQRKKHVGSAMVLTKFPYKLEDVFSTKEQ